MAIKTISADEFAAVYQRGDPLDVIDVRSPAEFEAVHIANSRLLPLDRLDAGAMAAAPHAGRPLYMMCRTGNRSRMAAEKLDAAGITGVVVVAGGIQACEKTNLPIERGRAAVSLERQVRIVAGSIVLAGVVCGFAVQPLFFLISGFVGAGLIFAGVTDTCAMGLALARMPWNQRSAAAIANAAAARP